MKWFTGAALPEDGNINALPDITYTDLRSHNMKTMRNGEDPYNVDVKEVALVLDSETHFKIKFTCDDAEALTIIYRNANGTKSGTITPVASGDFYIVEVPDIGAGDLMTRYTVKFDDNYSVEFDAMTYAYSVFYAEAHGSSFTEGLTDVLKALYVYGSAFAGN